MIFFYFLLFYYSSCSLFLHSTLLLCYFTLSCSCSILICSVLHLLYLAFVSMSPLPYPALFLPYLALLLSCLALLKPYFCSILWPPSKISYLANINPFAGAVGPAFLLSQAKRIASISSGVLLKAPTSINVPAMIRTML